MKKRKVNFSPGPAALPASVLQQLAAATLSYGSTGISVYELQHRGREFTEILEESNQLVRELCGIGSDYEVLWLHGGGRQQFCMIPMNFLGPGEVATFIDSGQWAREAQEYAAYYGDTAILSSSAAAAYSHLPQWPATLPEHTAYVHLTTNNTIYGTQWHTIPPIEKPLIADMSSDIFCAQRDYSRYAMFYAVAQKNLGVAGVALAVVHKDLLKKNVRPLPPMLSYKAQAAAHSVVNTANVGGIYASLLMLRWTKSKTIEAIAQENHAKAALLYTQLDGSKIFAPRVAEPSHRSITNVCFTAAPQHEAAFLQLCEAHNILGIKGHRYTGGFRASLYNAVSLADVRELVTLMQEYEAGV